MDGHLVLASSDSKIRCSLENFTMDVERWLAAFYSCVRTSYGNDAARSTFSTSPDPYSGRLRPGRTGRCLALSEINIAPLAARI
ncbi:MAG: hypothetical protein ABSD39_17950, partial [Terriglobales bacterium]